VVLGADARLAVVLAAGGERGGVEAVDGGAVGGLEARCTCVRAGGRHRVAADEQLVRPEVALALALDLAAEGAERRVVEAPARARGRGRSGARGRSRRPRAVLGSMTRDLLGLGERGFHATLRLGLGHVLDVRRQRPLVAVRDP
jgi:hypothetical protein